MNAKDYKFEAWTLLVFLITVLSISLLTAVKGAVFGFAGAAGWLGVAVNGLVLAFLVLRIPGAADVIGAWAVVLMLPAILFWVLIILQMLDPGSPGRSPARGEGAAILALIKHLLLLLGMTFLVRRKGIVAYWSSRFSKHTG